MKVVEKVGSWVVDLVVGMVDSKAVWKDDLSVVVWVVDLVDQKVASPAVH